MNENNFGWSGLIAGCICFYFLTRAGEETKFHLLFWVFALVVFIIFKVNVESKKTARKLRKQNELLDL